MHIYTGLFYTKEENSSNFKIFCCWQITWSTWTAYMIFLKTMNKTSVATDSELNY